MEWLLYVMKESRKRNGLLRNLYSQYQISLYVKTSFPVIKNI